jgi:hypothetical protein
VAAPIFGGSSLDFESVCAPVENERHIAIVRDGTAELAFDAERLVFHVARDFAIVGYGNRSLPFLVAKRVRNEGVWAAVLSCIGRVPWLFIGSDRTRRNDQADEKK